MAFSYSASASEYMILVVSCFLIFGLYLLLLLIYSYGWFLQKSFRYERDFIPGTKISVVIAARNESDNISKCLHSILSQNYPAHLFEIVVVDDFSMDDTAAIVRNIAATNVRLIALSDIITPQEKIISFKKKALSAGISESDGTLIVTTDADCWMQENWLRTIAALYEQKGAEMIVAPVRFSSNISLLQLFQSLDFMTMQGITAATVRLSLGIMCNGANLAFSRKAYDAVQGYEGVDHLVSGDDYLLQLKIKKQFPAGIAYLKAKEAIVDTLPQMDWRGFLQQRIRWASKTGKYDDPKITGILLLIYLFNCSLLIAGIFVLCGNMSLNLFLLLFGLKTIAELCFLYPVASFFTRRKQLFIFPFLQPFHILYIILAGFLSKAGKFEWKKRKSNQ